VLQAEPPEPVARADVLRTQYGNGVQRRMVPTEWNIKLPASGAYSHMSDVITVMLRRSLKDQAFLIFVLAGIWPFYGIF
jgi:hypothetical protein